MSVQGRIGRLFLNYSIHIDFNATKRTYYSLVYQLNQHYCFNFLKLIQNNENFKKIVFNFLLLKWENIETIVPLIHNFSRVWNVEILVGFGIFSQKNNSKLKKIPKKGRVSQQPTPPRIRPWTTPKVFCQFSLQSLLLAPSPNPWINNC